MFDHERLQMVPAELLLTPAVCIERVIRVAPKRWMTVTWLLIIGAIIGICALYGGRDCKVPVRGPFHHFLAGQEFVATPFKGVAGEFTNACLLPSLP